MGANRKDEHVKALVFAVALAGALTTSFLSAQQPQVPTILVSRQLAELEGLAVGETVQLATTEGGANSRTFEIAGIYEPTPDPMRFSSVRREVRMHLPDLLAMTRSPDTPAGTEHVESINVALNDPEAAGTFARDINARTPGVFARRTVGASGEASTFVVLERFHLAIAIVTIIAATVFLLALSIMLVEERRETVGVLRLIGFPAARILAQVLVEGLVIAGAGAMFGLVLARGSEGLINQFFQWRYDTALIFVRITPSVAALCVSIAVPLGAAATVVASWTLLRRSGLRLARR
jgi:putative ABC transport system permease protein